jgi:hypothetical protein
MPGRGGARARAGSWAASSNGLKVRRRPVKQEKHFPNFLFSKFFKYQFSNTILSNKITFSKNSPKMKVA